MTRLAPMLEDLHSRLAGVVIECLDWEAFIRRYDRPRTLFYIDPPYWGSETDYGRELFSREEFGCLAEALAGIEGRFLLSINDRPEIREIFGRFDMEDVETSYSLPGGGKAKKAGELIVSNGGGE